MRVGRWLIASAALVVTGMMGSSADGASGYINWPAYLYSVKHSSDAINATAITPANAGSVKLLWKFAPDTAPISGLGGFFASPTAYNGTIYIGSRNGYFYAIDEATGDVLWKRFVGYVTGKTCGPQGFTSTASVLPDPTSGEPTVYVYGATGDLYAMDTATGADVWPPAEVAAPSTTTNNYYAWGSPLVVGGNIYVGISSQCDKPLVQGGVKEFSQATGALENTYWSTPTGTVGASVWSSPVTTGSSVFVTTGNGNRPKSDGYSIVKLSPSLARIGAWKVPAAAQDVDSDFGGSPGIWTALVNGTATTMVGACNKNGSFYALNATRVGAGPVWSDPLGNPDSIGPGQCDAAPVWDGSHLYLAGNGTTINSVPYDGSVEEVDPGTGGTIWHTGLTGSVIGSPSLDGAGVLAAATYGSTTGRNGVYLIDASTGAILRTITYGTAQTFGQPVFADRYLLVASQGLGLRAYTVQ